MGVKVFKLNHKRWKAVGAAGNAYKVDPIINWLRGITKKEPDQYDEPGDILLIDHKNRCWIMNGQHVPIETPVPFAIGSGGDYAMGAMALGADAMLAVEIASELDVNTGNGYDAIKVT